MREDRQHGRVKDGSNLGTRAARLVIGDGLLPPRRHRRELAYLIAKERNCLWLRRVTWLWHAHGNCIRGREQTEWTMMTRIRK